jgi:hypothetical protein
VFDYIGLLVLTIRTSTAIISIAPMITMAQIKAGVIGAAGAGAGGMLITGAGTSFTVTGGGGAGGGAAALAIVVKVPIACGLTVGSTAVMAKK